ncbi:MULTISPECIES: hypothetical protein [unclassified Acidisoma]|uniref:hypothetical protein n=1 Tax=unclassified Acidisoma TaxID=2634065 RepID=UPI00131C1F44|nr:MULTISPECIES: hypothetical protein [unclassified Acidisoma]
MSTCMPLIDARIPISIVTVPSGTPDAASLVEGDGEVAAGVAAAYFQEVLPSHAPGCACCLPRSAAGAALGALFRARALGTVPFFTRVEVLLATPSAEAALRQAVEADPVAASYFRLG